MVLATRFAPSARRWTSLPPSPRGSQYLSSAPLARLRIRRSLSLQIEAHWFCQHAIAPRFGGRCAEHRLFNHAWHDRDDSSAARQALTLRAAASTPRVGFLVGPVDPPVATSARPRPSSVAACANRSAARPDTRTFRGLNGRLPALALLRRAPAIYSTVPLRPRFTAALLVSHGDRRMRGRSQLNTAPNAEGSTAESGSLGN